jgi:hypothetical protein
MAVEIKESSKRWITFKNLAVENKLQSRWPHSEAAIRGLFAAAERKGLSGAFRKVGRRCLVSPEELYRLVEGKEVKNDGI